MKYNNLVEVQKGIQEVGIENVLMFNGNGSGFYLVNSDKSSRQVRCRMYQDFEKAGDGIYWLMQSASVIKAEYSRQDIMENEMWKNHSTKINNGQTYLIVDMRNADSVTAVKVQAKVNGDYSDAAVFNEI